MLFPEIVPIIFTTIFHNNSSIDSSINFTTNFCRSSPKYPLSRHLVRSFTKKTFCMYLLNNSFRCFSGNLHELLQDPSRRSSTTVYEEVPQKVTDYRSFSPFSPLHFLSKFNNNSWRIYLRRKIFLLPGRENNCDIP